MTRPVATTGGPSQPASRGAYSNTRAEPLSFEQVDAAVSYDPATGIFTTKIGTKKGRQIGHLKIGGYVQLRICKRSLLAHRVAWLLVHGRWPSLDIDHIDHNRANNVISNLREATVSQNAQNARNKGYTRQFKGSGFLARIKVRDKVLCLGTYPTEQEARAAYVAASLKYFGEFSAFHQGGDQ